jgi:hypothetical protein
MLLLGACGIAITSGPRARRGGSRRPGSTSPDRDARARARSGTRGTPGNAVRVRAGAHYAVWLCSPRQRAPRNRGAGARPDRFRCPALAWRGCGALWPARARAKRGRFICRSSSFTDGWRSRSSRAGRSRRDWPLSAVITEFWVARSGSSGPAHVNALQCIPGQHAEPADGATAGRARSAAHGTPDAAQTLRRREARAPRCPGRRRIRRQAAPEADRVRARRILNQESPTSRIGTENASWNRCVVPGELILDTGRSFPVLDRSQRQHAECVKVDGWDGPVLSTGRAHRGDASLGRVHGGRRALPGFLSIGQRNPGARHNPLRRCRELLEEYSDLPMDFADATLVALAEKWVPIWCSPRTSATLVYRLKLSGALSDPSG